ncbi:hypothetical protein HRR95_004445 [Exophiala dermatitidis]|nr:hypothetical protein HRR95_004445 [Exophiala dermatitidis]
MSKSIVNKHKYPFQFTNPIPSPDSTKSGGAREVSITLPNRTEILPRFWRIVALWMDYRRALWKKLDFPWYSWLATLVPARMDTGYIAMQEMCDKIQEAVRQVSVPVMADGDTGYGSPMNVRRTVESFALAGAAGVMIEDQTWPKRCGHTKGKSVVSRGEAYARIQAAVDARNEGLDIFVLARTDSLILGWDEAITRAKRFRDIGVDAVFIEALPDRESMKRAVKEVGIPTFANIIEGGLTENLSAKDLAELGMCAVAYPWRLVAAKIKAIREALETLKESMTVGAPSTILSYSEVCEGVGFNKYWDLEERYKYTENDLVNRTGSSNGLTGH